MKFEKKNIFTVLTADDVKIGSIGFFADTLSTLRCAVEEEDSKAKGEIQDILEEDNAYRFLQDNGNASSLFFLVEEPFNWAE